MPHTAVYMGAFPGCDGQIVILYAAVNNQTGDEDDSASYCMKPGDARYQIGSQFSASFAASLVARADNTPNIHAAGAPGLGG